MSLNLGPVVGPYEAYQRFFDDLYNMGRPEAIFVEHGRSLRGAKQVEAQKGAAVRPSEVGRFEEHLAPADELRKL